MFACLLITVCVCYLMIMDLLVTFYPGENAWGSVRVTSQSRRSPGGAVKVAQSRATRCVALIQGAQSRATCCVALIQAAKSRQSPGRRAALH